MKNWLFILTMAFLLTGCGVQVVGKYTVSHDEDRFTDTFKGRTVTFENWTLKIGDKTLEIPHETSVIEIVRKGKHLSITVNGKLLYEE